MKKIEVKKEVINYQYEAADGTIFGDADECRMYEESAFGVLRGRLAKIATTFASECDIFNGAGSDENDAFVVIPKNEDEVKTIQQIVYMKSYGDKAAVAEKVAIGKVLLVTFSYDNDGVWITDLGKLIDSATKGKYEVVEKKES